MLGLTFFIYENACVIDAIIRYPALHVSDCAGLIAEPVMKFQHRLPPSSGEN